MCRGRMSLGVLCVLVCLVGEAWAEIPTVISYQGKVTDTSGNPVPDNNYTMRFRIYNVSAGGTALWDSGARTVAVAGGVFSVLLGESPQPALGLAFDADYWLLVTFAGVDQTPRQRLASTGYAYMASGLVPGTEVSGSLAGNVLTVVNSSAAGDASALRAFSSAGSGFTHGVYAEVSSPDGSAVLARGLSGTGTAYGVHAQSLSSSGRALYGQAAATTGTTYGVYGTSASSAGIGVFGLASATGGITYGGWFESASSTGRGLYAVGPYGGVIGICTDTYGPVSGVSGVCHSVHGGGINGLSTATGGSTFGGYFTANSPNGTGAKGIGERCGLEGLGHSSTANRGVVGWTLATTGTSSGVEGLSGSPSGRGVFGHAEDTTGSGYAYGVYGKSDSPWDGAGVRGEAMAASTGHATFGVYGSTGSTTGYGVYGCATTMNGNYGLYAYGNIGATGTKSAVVEAAPGDWRHLYAMESPDVLFEDVGTGRIVHGRAVITIDPTFARTVSLDVPYQVFLTPRADCALYLVETTSRTFAVGVVGGATPDLAFDYRIIAKRRGYEDIRLALASDPEQARRSPYKTAMEPGAGGESLLTIERLREEQERVEELRRSIGRE